MKTSALKTTLVSVLLLAPPAALLRAQETPPPPPAAPRAVPAPPEAPEAPAPPAPPEARKRRKKIVVASPEKEIVVDGDRIFIAGDDEPDLMADVEGLDDPEVHPFVMRMHGHSGGGFIGVRPVEMTPELRQHFGAPKDAGVFVGSVEPDSPAARAGLQVGDIVTKVDGDRIASTGELVRAVRHRKGGETITVEVLRNRTAKSLTVTVGERKDKEVRVGEMKDGFPRRDWGWAWKTPEPLLPPDFEQRLDELEKKMKELEGRLQAR